MRSEGKPSVRAVDLALLTLSLILIAGSAAAVAPILLQEPPAQTHPILVQAGETPTMPGVYIGPCHDNPDAPCRYKVVNTTEPLP